LERGRVTALLLALLACQLTCHETGPGLRHPFSGGSGRCQIDDPGGALRTTVESTSTSKNFDELGLGSVTKGALVLVYVLAVHFVENFNEMLYEETTSPGLRHPFLGGEQTGQAWDDPGGDLWTDVCATGTALELRPSANRTVCSHEDARRLVVGSGTSLLPCAQAGVAKLALLCSILAVPWSGTGCATIENTVVTSQGCPGYEYLY